MLAFCPIAVFPYLSYVDNNHGSALSSPISDRASQPIYKETIKFKIQGEKFSNTSRIVSYLLYKRGKMNQKFGAVDGIFEKKIVPSSE